MVANGETNNDDTRHNMFTVTMKKKEVVAAVLPLQEHWLTLSNLDLLLPPLDVGVLFCYKNKNMMLNTSNNNGHVSNDTSFGSMVGVLKKALAQVLVSYYAFAGEVVANSVGEPELLCNNRGVDFFEAFADVDLQDLDLYNPDESVQGKLVPQMKDGVLAVQATELKCGSLVVACSFDHRVSDAYSANMFLVSWAETARSEAITFAPSFRRSLLNPRHPGLIDPSLDTMYVPLSEMPLPDPNKDPNADHLISRIYYVKSEELIKLQGISSTNSDKRTKLESFSAFLWQMVAKSSVNITNRKNINSTKLGIVVDGRTRLSDLNNEGPQWNNSMSNYFGNVLSIPYGSKGIKEVIENPLNWVAIEVHKFLETGVTKEHFLGLIDWVEARRPEPAAAKIYLEEGTGPSFVVSSGQWFPASKIDFGWGCPFFGSYHFPWGGSCGYVMPMPSPLQNGDWIVYMHLMSEQVKYIEAEAAHFFNPITFDYLNSIVSN